MDNQTLINLSIGGFGGLISFLISRLWEAVRDLQKSDKDIADKVSSIEVLVAGKYVTQDKFDGVVNKLFEKIDKISDLLQNKADRP